MFKTMLHDSLRSQHPRLLYTGLLVTVVIALAKFFGVFQSFELKTLDVFLRFRPAEAIDERITIVEVTDEDISKLATYPIPDSVLFEALATIQQYQPRAIGLDIFRDFPVYDLSLPSHRVDTTGHRKFIEIIQNNQNIVVVDSILAPVVLPPPDIPLEQVGFADSILDEDGFVRRSLLGSPDEDGQFRFSFTILLAQKYLEGEGFELKNGRRDPVAMRFGDVELSSVHSTSRGYITSHIGGNPVVLINFRSGPTPFSKVSLSDLLAGDIRTEWFKDRIVLIGITAVSAKDFVNSDAVSTSNPGLVSGIELQAHAISQILESVLDERPILKTWPPLLDYLWMILWGFFGIGLSHFIRIPFIHILIGFFSTTGIFLLGYCILFLGWWIPIVPAGIAYFFNGAVLYGFYWYQQSLKLRIEERQRVIRESYGAIHNGPLQTLAEVLKIQQAEDGLQNRFRDKLQQLDRELRDVYEFMERAALDPEHQLYLTGNFTVDLSEPLHELLYQVYDKTMLRSLPCFSDIQIYITQFEPLAEKALSLEQKQEIARFLEEALCNVGRYAKDATRLEITCMQVEDQNVISVADNGKGLETKQPSESRNGGRGTRQAVAIAKTLSGTFRREPNKPNGTVCELIWPKKTPKCWWFWG